MDAFILVRVQTVRIQLPQDLVSTSGGKPGTIRLGLRTQNERGVFSPVSNVVPVVWNTRPKPSPVTLTTATNKPHTIPSKIPPAGNISTTLSSKVPQTASKTHEGTNKELTAVDEAIPTADSTATAASATTTSPETTRVVPMDDYDPEDVHTKSKSRTSNVTLLVVLTVVAVIMAAAVIGLYAVMRKCGGKSLGVDGVAFCGGGNSKKEQASAYTAGVIRVVKAATSASKSGNIQRAYLQMKQLLEKIRDDHLHLQSSFKRLSERANIDSARQHESYEAAVSRVVDLILEVETVLKIDHAAGIVSCKAQVSREVSELNGSLSLVTEKVPRYLQLSEPYLGP